MEDSVNQSLESQGNSSNIDALGQILIIVYFLEWTAKYDVSSRESHPFNLD